MSIALIVLLMQMSQLTGAGDVIVRATMASNSVYVPGTSVDKAGPLTCNKGGKLSLLRMSLFDNAKASIFDCKFNVSSNLDALLRWQIRDGNLVITVFSGGGDGPSEVRAGELRTAPLLEIETANARAREWMSFPNWPHDYERSIIRGPYLSSVRGSIGLHGDGYLLDSMFDICFNGSTHLEVYHNVISEFEEEFRRTIGASDKSPNKNGRRMVRFEFRPEQKVRGGMVHGKWELTGDWTYKWSGPFYVATNKDDRFFVTDSGHVFVAPQKTKAGTPLKEIWKGKPVDALIHDSDAAKWYAFTKDQYFEVADPIKPLAHTVAIRRSNKADEALVTAAKCGRVIRGIPEPKEK